MNDMKLKAKFTKPDESECSSPLREVRYHMRCACALYFNIGLILFEFFIKPVI